MLLHFKGLRLPNGEGMRASDQHGVIELHGQSSRSNRSVNQWERYTRHSSIAADLLQHFCRIAQNTDRLTRGCMLCLGIRPIVASSSFSSFSLVYFGVYLFDHFLCRSTCFGELETVRVHDCVSLMHLMCSVIFDNENENEMVKNEKITNSLTKTKTKTKK